MPKVVFIEPNGARKEVLAPNGSSAMRVAVENGIAGIIGECNGNAVCGTCHVYVLTEHVDGPLPGSNEDILLDFTHAPRRPNSRLGCQLVLDENAVDLVLEVPAEADE